MAQQLDISSLWPYLGGYFFATVVAHFCIDLVVSTLWKDLGRNRIPTAWILGIIERALYLAAFQMDKVEFVALWLTLKVASGWGRWSKSEKSADGKNIEGRAIFNIFLIGSGLSIAFALVAAKSTGWLLAENWLLSITVPGVLVVATLVLWRCLILLPKTK